MKKTAVQRRKEKITVARNDTYHEVWSALDKILEAWDSPARADMPRWMVEEMIPAINKGRKAMGRKAPDG